MPDQQIFFDPERKRWKRLRRIFDATAVVSTLVVAGFIFNVIRNQRLPELLLPSPKHNYRALPGPTILERTSKNQRPTRRKTGRKPSDIPLNTGEGLRAAYYVQDDAASYSSLKEHIHQIDMLFPMWLHVDSPNGTLMMMSGDNLSEYPVIQGAAVHDPDYLDKVKQVIQKAKEDTEVFPAINNFNPHTQEWDTGVGDVLTDPGKRAALLQQIMRFLGTIRANSQQRQADINALAAASNSTDPTQQTELATLQRINRALILQLMAQQEANQISQANTLQQIVSQKQQQDALKATFQQANQFQSGYIAVAPSYAGAAAAMRY